MTDKQKQRKRRRRRKKKEEEEEEEEKEEQEEEQEERKEKEEKGIPYFALKPQRALFKSDLEFDHILLVVLVFIKIFLYNLFLRKKAISRQGAVILIFDTRNGPMN